ncbi:restriction endonuclease, partial [Streptomyces glaucus]|uniref:restriction endonuclease n=1 Tax=Streptomyces glaucus TaxID=284029 RepID=UPI0031E20984
RRRWSLARAARRAGAALDEAAREAAGELRAPAAPGPVPAGSPAAATGPVPPAGPAGPADPVESAGAARAAGTVPGAAPEPTAVLAAVPVAYDALDPDEFEQAIAALCLRDGCPRAEVVGGAGDLGADVLAVTPDGRRVVIQCKRYGDGNRVGSQDLQRFGGTCFTVHGADVAVVVTTSDFTAPAVEYAEQCGIVCVDGRALRAWSEGTGPEPWRYAPAGGPC